MLASGSIVFLSNHVDVRLFDSRWCSLTYDGRAPNTGGGPISASLRAVLVHQIGNDENIPPYILEMFGQRSVNVLRYVTICQR